MGFMIRNGNLARLPRAIRDELSRRPQDGEPGKHLVQWLNWNPSPKHWDVPALHHLSAILSPVCHPPRALRDGLNRRMDDGQTGTEAPSVVERIAGSQKLLAEHFAGRPVSKQNLSEWKAGLPGRSLLAKDGLPRRSLLAKAGGHRLWLTGRETLTQTR